MSGRRSPLVKEPTVQPDFPAAHSMDSVWFAVDADGHVAAFTTGEDGHIPTQGNGGYGWEVLEEMEELTGKPDNDDDETDQRCTKLGLFSYDFGWGGEPIDPYSRTAVPDEPLHVEQLPPNLRKRVQEAKFPGICFLKTERIQPFEWYDECDGYRIEDLNAYLCADGKTVKPLPGNEEYFEEWVQAWSKENPEAAARLVFDIPPKTTDGGE
jgi:hypothetical protein